MPKHLPTEAERSQFSTRSQPSNAVRLDNATPDTTSHDARLSNPATSSPALRTPATLLALQGTIGNQAVQRMLRPSAALTPVSVPPTGDLVQRSGRGGKMNLDEDEESEEEEIEEEEGSDYELNLEEEAAFLNDPDEKYRAPGESYRSGVSFYTAKGYDTRKIVTNRQMRGGKLYSPSGRHIPLQGGKEVRQHKTEGAKNRAPDIDHKIDYLALDAAIDENSQDVSDAEEAALREYAYNYPDNLEILSKDEHKAKPTYRRDTLPPAVKKEAKKLFKEKIREDFKKHQYAQRRRNQIRKRLRRDAPAWGGQGKGPGNWGANHPLGKGPKKDGDGGGGGGAAVS